MASHFIAEVVPPCNGLLNMGKDPAFLFYTNDFFSGTQFFTDEQVGKYLRLLMAQHQHGHLSEKHMIMICNSYDVDIWNKFTKDADGKFYQKRLEEEIFKRKAYSESRATNRKSKGKHKKHKKNISKTYQSDMENENKDENINKDKIKNEITFPFDSEKFKFTWSKWLQYRKEINHPYKSPLSQQAALKTLSKHSEQTAIEMIEQSIANSWQGIFEIKNGKPTKRIGSTPEELRDVAEYFRKKG